MRNVEKFHENFYEMRGDDGKKNHTNREPSNDNTNGNENMSENPKGSARIC